MPPSRSGRSMSRRSSPRSPHKPSPKLANSGTSNRNKSGSRSTSREDFSSAQPELPSIEQILETVEERSSEGTGGSFLQITRSNSSPSLESDLDQLKPDLIIDELDNLHGDSVALLSLFDLPEEDLLRTTISEISQPNSRQHSKLHRLAKRLAISRQNFGEGTFINPPLVVRGLRGIADLHRINYGRWRPDAVLYQANLALQMVALLDDSVHDRDHFFDYMYNNFPDPFVGKSDFPFGTALEEETRELGTDLSTQFFIHRIQHDKSEEANRHEMTATQIFLNDKNFLRDSRDNSSQDRLRRRLKQVKKFFTTDRQHPVLLDGLKNKFPWIDFIVKVAKWSVARKVELQSVINKQGGIGNIVSLLESGAFEEDVMAQELSERGRITQSSAQSAQSNENQLADRMAGYKPHRGDATERSNNWSSKPPSGSMLAAEIGQYRKEAAKHAEEVSGLGSRLHNDSPRQNGPEIAQSLSSANNGHEDRPLHDDDDSGVREPSAEPIHPSMISHRRAEKSQMIVPTQLTNDVMQKLRECEQNKENLSLSGKKSLLDRQPDAHRVEWEQEGFDSDEELLSESRPAKRVAAESRTDDEVDDEEGFEADARPAKKSRIASEKQPISHRGTKRLHDEEPAFHDDIDNNEDDNLTPHQPPPEMTLSFEKLGRPETSRSKIQYSTQSSTLARDIKRAASGRVIPASTAPPSYRPRSPPRTTVARVNREAKAAVAQAKDLSNQMRTQVRRAWTEDETLRLMEMVERCGTRWARILDEDLLHEDGPELQARSQVALKDKARNIKMDYLKARRPLPPNFELVTLGENYVDQLRAVGIVYVHGRQTVEE